MKTSVTTTKIFALAMILVLPLILAGCGKKPAPEVLDNNTPSSQTPSGSLAPVDEGLDGSGNLFDTAPPSSKEIKSDDDIEAILNNINNDDSRTLQDVDDSDLYNF